MHLNRGGMTVNETEVIQNVKDGNMDAFNILFEEYSKKALRTAYLITGRKDICEDIVQEAFIQCYRQIKSLKNPETFKSWFYKILTRISWRYCSKQKIQLSIENINDSYMDVFSDDHTLSEVVETNEIRNLINKSLDKLPLSMKVTVILYYYNELSVKDIARISGCFEGTVKSRLYNARKLLEKEFRKKEFQGYSFYEEVQRKEYGKNAKPKTT